MKRIATLAIVSLLLLCSCGKTEPQKFTAYYFDFFDTATTIVGYAESKEEFDAVCEEICAQFSEYHKLYTIYNRYDGVNNMYAVNRADGPISVDAKIIDMLSFAKD